MFKPIVMFFRLTNFLAIFQTIINKILQNLINIEKVVSFIDDIIVGINIEEGHNKIVKRTIRRLVENNLYIEQKKVKDILD